MDSVLIILVLHIYFGRKSYCQSHINHGNLCKLFQSFTLQFNSAFFILLWISSMVTSLTAEQSVDNWLTVFLCKLAWVEMKSIFKFANYFSWIFKTQVCFNILAMEMSVYICNYLNPAHFSCYTYKQLALCFCIWVAQSGGSTFKNFFKSKGWHGMATWRNMVIISIVWYRL